MIRNKGEDSAFDVSTKTRQKLHYDLKQLANNFHNRLVILNNGNTLQLKLYLLPLHRFQGHFCFIVDFRQNRSPFQRSHLPISSSQTTRYRPLFPLIYEEVKISQFLVYIYTNRLTIANFKFFCTSFRLNSNNIDREDYFAISQVTFHLFVCVDLLFSTKFIIVVS